MALRSLLTGLVAVNGDQANGYNRRGGQKTGVDDIIEISESRNCIRHVTNKSN